MRAAPGRQIGSPLPATQSSKAPAADLVIGKDIVELLSTAMYIEPLTLIPEYIQNAADSIDQAIINRTLVGQVPGRIDISLDPVARTLRIRDNGEGVRISEAERVLTAFGS